MYYLERLFMYCMMLQNSSESMAEARVSSFDINILLLCVHLLVLDEVSCLPLAQPIVCCLEVMLVPGDSNLFAVFL